MKASQPKLKNIKDSDTCPEQFKGKYIIIQ